MSDKGCETGCAMVLCNLSRKLYNVGAPEASDALLMQLIGLLKRRSDKNSAWGQAMALHALGSLNMRSGNKKLAAIHYRRSLEIHKQLDPWKPEVALTLRALALCELNIDDIQSLTNQARAIEQRSGQTSALRLDSLTQMLESRGLEIPTEIRTFAGLANDENHRGVTPVNNHRIEQDQQQHNATQENLSDEDYYKQLLSLLNYALTLAKQHFAESWSGLWSTSADSYWNSTLSLLRIITDCQRKSRDLSASIISWKEIVSILENTRGQSNHFLKQALLQLSEVYQELGQMRMAEQYKARALAMDDHKNGPGSI